MDVGIPVGRPGLEHADGRAAVLAEPMGENAAGGAGADDDIVEGVHSDAAGARYCDRQDDLALVDQRSMARDAETKCMFCFAGRTVDVAETAIGAVASSEMMHTQGGEGAVMGLVTIARRLSEEAEMQRQRVQQGHRHRARRVEQRCAVVGGVWDSAAAGVGLRMAAAGCSAAPVAGAGSARLASRPVRPPTRSLTVPVSDDVSCPTAALRPATACDTVARARCRRVPRPRGVSSSAGASYSGVGAAGAVVAGAVARRRRLMRQSAERPNRN